MVDLKQMLKQKKTSKYMTYFIEGAIGRYAASYKKTSVAPELHVSIHVLQLTADLESPDVFTFSFLKWK